MPPDSFRWLTADEWDTTENLWLMLHNAEQQTGDQRKLSLFGVACCRRHWSALLPESQAVLMEFETLLDRLSRLSSADVCQARTSLSRRANAAVGLMRSHDPSLESLRLAAAKAVCYAVIGSAWGAHGYFLELDPSEMPHQIHLLRDIFGNPFRPVSLNPAWRTETVVSMGMAIYNNRTFSHLPIWADALEDAGCENREILQHCRHPGPHVRGCWPLDLLLGLKVEIRSSQARRSEHEEAENQS
jgi:hypothetical protein